MQKTTQGDTTSQPVLSDKDEAGRLFVSALDEAYWARLRARQRTRVVGFHGTDFEDRDANVELIVAKFNERAVKIARKNALHAGWTKQQLAALELDAESGSHTAQV